MINYWSTATSGDWNTASNWTDGLPGSNGDGQIIGPAGTYTVTLSSAGSSALSLLMLAAGATFSETSTGTLNLGDYFFLQAGTAILRNANTITSGVNLSGGLLETSNAGALGSAAFTISGGEFVGLTTETVANALNMSGAFTIAAATGTTLTLNGAPGWVLDTGTTINFGDATNKGTVVWYTPGGSIMTLPASSTVEVYGGTTLKSGGGGLAGLLGSVSSTTVDAGAKIDVNGFSTGINNLQGQGVVTNSGAAAVLTIVDGNFYGAITGPLFLTFDGVVELSGTNTYTGDTTIDPTGHLSLGGGGSMGSIAGSILDNGTLTLYRNNTMTLANAITGSGTLVQQGFGTTIINHADSYSGGTTISAGKLQIGNGGALGSGVLAIDGGELVGLASETVANELAMFGNFTIAAATGRTLKLHSASGWNLASGAVVNFGDATNKGTVVWYTPADSVSPPLGTYSVEVHGGTLKVGDDNSGVLLDNSGLLTVDAGATIDTNGFSTMVANLQGNGVVADSGVATVLEIDDGNFAGQINGPLGVRVIGTVTLSGGGNFTGGADITQGATLHLAGTTLQTVNFDGPGTLSLSNAAHVAGTLNITAESGGQATVTGAAGDDTFAFGASLKANDKVNGGAGTDTVTLNGNYSAGLTFTSTTLVNVENLKLAAGHSYKLTTNNATVASGKTLTVDGSALTTTHVLTFNGSAETDGHFVIIGGKGGDKLTGGALSDTFVYTSASQSMSTHYDTITGFNFAKDIFNIPGGVDPITGINTKVTTGSLSTASFDADLTAAMSDHLGAHHAILFTPNAGTFSGDTFLVVDLNGTAGYQTGHDLVIRMISSSGTLAAGGFH